VSKLDVLMVTPPSRLDVYQGLANEYAAIEPPVWSGLIAEYLRRHGYSVGILDAEAEGYTHEETAWTIVDADPLLAVFAIYGQQPSASTQCMPGGRRTCATLNDQTGGSIATIALGTHPSALPVRTLREEPYTYVCQGEGPLTVQALIHTLKECGDLSRVPGLCYFDKDGHPRLNTPAPIIEDLERELPRQAWDLLDMKKYRAHNWHCFHDLASRGSYASLQTSLGCPFKCSFCCINAPFGVNMIRFWSPDRVIGQIDELVTVHGVRNIKIPDEMFVLNPRQVGAICDRIIERGYQLNLWAYARVDTLNDMVMLENLKRAGFNWLGVGIESASEHVRDGVVKGRFGNSDIARAVRRTEDAGIAVAANYIFGLPDDTLDSMRATLDLALTLNTPWANFYSAMAYPGSQLYPQAKSKGWALPDDPGGPGWIGYSQHAYECLPLPTHHVSAETVLDFRDSAFNAYFSSTMYLRMVANRFDAVVGEHIRQMTRFRLPRKHHQVDQQRTQETSR
jgi:radical SAM superfamily enzyme YgiQ (UPF0313 family)